jgi:CRISPR-associated protein Csd2
MPTAMTMHIDITRRHDFVLLFDVSDGNPNGDPDAGNLPRVDPETMQGLVTDVALKRKVRDFVDVAQGDQGRFKIYVQSGGDALNAIHRRAYEALEMKSSGTKQNKDDVDKARAWMCQNLGSE